MQQDGHVNYHMHITSTHRWYDINLKEVWLYRDLIMLFVKRNFALTYKQTILGPIWLFLSPFITSIMFTFVFGEIAGISTNGIPQIIFYLCSNALWNFFAECVNRNSATFVSNSNVFGKVYFPRITVPISNAISSFVRFGIQMCMVAVFLGYYIIRGEISPNWLAWLIIPVILLQLAGLGMGVGILISSLTTKYRDLFIVVGFGISLWMYATPVVYPLSQIDEGMLKTLILINPVTTSIEMFRYAVLGEGTIAPQYILVSFVLTIFIAFLGMIMFSRVEKTFMDTV